MKRPLLILCALLVDIAVAQCGDLDGTSWSVQMTPSSRSARAGESPHSEKVIFASGNMVGSQWVLRGFVSQPYSGESQGKKAMAFNSEQNSATGQGRAKWSGIVKGERIEGTLLWIKPDGKVRVFNFAGKKE